MPPQGSRNQNLNLRLKILVLRFRVVFLLRPFSMKGSPIKLSPKINVKLKKEARLKGAHPGKMPRMDDIETAKMAGATSCPLGSPGRAPI